MQSVTTFSKKPLLCLVTAQAVCLALGLWIQDRLVAFSLRKPPTTATVSTVNDSQRGQAQVDASAKLKAPPTSDRELRDAMQIARLFSFLWIAGMQAGIAYLVLSRAHSESSQRQMQAVNDSLLREKDLARTQNAVIFGLAKLAESRDPATGQHLERIAHFSTRFATVLRRMPKYRNQVTPAFIRSIGISSALHDIGKVGIEDQVLLKPGLLNAQERHHIQLHAALGGECLRQIELQLGSSNFLEMAREIAFCHHEHWNGEGYPAGLAGEAIPLAARIVAIADVYDALSVRRVYKQALPHEQCVEIIVNEAGKQFDPDLVDVFLSIEGEFREIARKYASPTDDVPASPCPSSDVKKPQAKAKSSESSDLLEPSTEPAPDIPSLANR